MTQPTTTALGTDMQQAARDHLWMHMTAMGPIQRGADVPGGLYWQ